MTTTVELTERQRREIEYHQSFASQHAQDVLREPLDYGMLKGRRWWNQYWEFFYALRSIGLTEKRVLVVGCGMGEDAIRIARMGARVDAFDLSPDVLAVARQLARREGVDVTFTEAPSERLPYEDGSFDVIVMRDIMHHVDIPVTVNELVRVSKPGATWVVSEIYSHSWTDVVRRSWLVDKVLYPAMQNFVYDGKVYITEDERKLTEKDLREVVAPLYVTSRKWFCLFLNRLFPDKVRLLSKMDRVLLEALGPLGAWLAGRVILTGRLVNGSGVCSPHARGPR
jgi:ubiquinone/menaquinone biosynthesis C-methylase UbiE